MQNSFEPSTDCSYEELAHTSEIGLSLQADTAVDLFICAAQVMFHLIQPDPPSPTREMPERHQITLSAPDPESLFIDWLNELLYLYETAHLVIIHYHMEIWEPTMMEATVSGAQADRQPAKHIKAATYHQLEVNRTARGWQARVFFDI